MFTQRELSQILFIDIETATVVSRYETLSPHMRLAWEHEARKIQEASNPAATAEDKFYRYASLQGEFGRVVCLSAAYLKFTQSQPALILKSFCGFDEKRILQAFGQLFPATNRFAYVCAHNGREFDFPFLSKRYLINQIPLPSCLILWDKAIWETRHLLDTMQLWKFSSFRESRRLELICAALDIATPKDDLQGNQVNDVFWQQEDLERIARYCENDVLALVQIVLRLAYLPALRPEQIQRRQGMFTPASTLPH